MQISVRHSGTCLLFGQKRQVGSQHDVQPDQVGQFTIARALSYAAVQFVMLRTLLNHLPPRDLAPAEISDPVGWSAHPLRRIASFDYVMERLLRKTVDFHDPNLSEIFIVRKLVANAS